MLYPGHLSYPSTEKQLVYSTTAADRATKCKNQLHKKQATLFMLLEYKKNQSWTYNS